MHELHVELVPEQDRQGSAQGAHVLFCVKNSVVSQLDWQKPASATDVKL